MIKDYSEVLEILEKKGWEECSSGNWRKIGRATLYADMPSLCGEEFEVKEVYPCKQAVEV